MYINKVTIKNVRSIKDFTMTFPEAGQPGWHVLIGDNGSGKSTILRCIALCLFGPEFAPAIRSDWENWLSNKSPEGNIELIIHKNDDQDYPGKKVNFPIKWKFIRYQTYVGINVRNGRSDQYRNLIHSMWFDQKEWFSAGFGPFRRFTGGSGQWDSIYETPNYSRLASHLSLFDESVALTEVTKWLRNLKLKSLENRFDFLHDIVRLVNSKDFLPQNTQLESVSSEGVFFKNPDGNLISIEQLSDGFRSILSLTFELLRILSERYSSTSLVSQHQEGYWYIDKPGVVLIDEVDAHLHPSWQTRIGQWFTKYFPNIQFIVTTHSPLVCRAAEKGTIWRLPVPGTNKKPELIVGIDRERLIDGNILDAYGTEVFGESVVRSKKSEGMKERLGELNIRFALDDLSAAEKKERLHLKKILSTDDPTGFKKNIQKSN